MNRLIYLAMLPMMLLVPASCDNDDLESHSIFEDDKSLQYNKFDQWLLDNYTYPYGIDVEYKLEQLETDLKYTLAPVDYDKAQILARIFKHVWIEAYNEVAGIEFTREHLPREIILVGSGQYNSEGGNPGLSEDGVRVTLYKCNEFFISAGTLNTLFLHNLHHTMVHYMLNDKKIDASFQKVSSGSYTYADWYLRTYIEAYTQGFVTPYAGGWPDDDVAELVSTYLTAEPADWNNMMTYAGEEGRAKIETKLDIVRHYFSKTWGIDLDRLKDVVCRRLSEVETKQVDVCPIDNINPDYPSILY